MAGNSRCVRACTALLAAAFIGVAVTPGLASAAAKTQLVSKASGGQKGDQPSNEPSASKTGRFIAFNSSATNLVGGDTNDSDDCFVHDRAKGITTRTSVQTGGAQSNGDCFGPAISQDGRWVAFDSDATDLGSSNGQVQVYLHDLQNGTTVLVSESTGGGQGGNARSGDPAVSGNGRYVVFESAASNLVNGDANGRMDVFLWDRQTKVIRLVSRRSNNGNQGNRNSLDPAISANGSFIVFTSSATNLVPKDTNGKQDVFIHKRSGGQTWRVSINSQGKQGNGPSGNASVSADGRWVAFESLARNLAGADPNNNLDVFVRDRKNGRTIKVSLGKSGQQADGQSGDPTVSSSGRYIAFESSATNLVAKDPKNRDVFLRDRVKRTTKIVSRRANGKPAGGHSDDPFVSGDGRFVFFESEAKNIVAKDTDALADIFGRGPLR